MTFLIEIVTGDPEQVFFVYLFLNSSVNIYYKGILALILSLSTMTPKTSLVILVLFIGLTLIDRK